MIGTSKGMLDLETFPAVQVLEPGCKYRRLPKQRSIQNPQKSLNVYKLIVQMILPQVHLQKPCYDFSFL